MSGMSLFSAFSTMTCIAVSKRVSHATKQGGMREKKKYTMALASYRNAVWVLVAYASRLSLTLLCKANAQMNW